MMMVKKKKKEEETKETAIIMMLQSFDPINRFCYGFTSTAVSLIPIQIPAHSTERHHTSGTAYQPRIELTFLVSIVAELTPA